jgi:hypothetical protein
MIPYIPYKLFEITHNLPQNNSECWIGCESDIRNPWTLFDMYVKHKLTDTYFDKETDTICVYTSPYRYIIINLKKFGDNIYKKTINKYNLLPE